MITTLWKAKLTETQIFRELSIELEGVPFSKELLLQTERLQQQTECIAVI